MFPPDVKDALDGMPLAIQVGVSLAALIFALCCMAAVVTFARKKETRVSTDNAALLGHASIISMEPVREGVNAFKQMVERQNQFLDNQRRMIEQHDRNSQLLERLIELLRDNASEQRARDRFRDRDR